MANGLKIDIDKVMTLTAKGRDEVILENILLIREDIGTLKKRKRLDTTVSGTMGLIGGMLTVFMSKLTGLSK